MNEYSVCKLSAIGFASFFFPPILLVALGLLLSTCYQHVDPFDDWILHHESRNMYGVVIDSSSGGKLDSVFIGEKKDWYTVVQDHYFDSLAAIGAPLKYFRDSCQASTFSFNGDIVLNDTSYYRQPRDHGEMRDLSVHPKSELLFAYKKGFKLWRYDPLRDTLTVIADDSYIGIKEFHLSTIKLVRL